MVQQMEKHRVTYEEKALLALQKATQEKYEALSKAETLQVKEHCFDLTAEISPGHLVFRRFILVLVTCRQV